MWHQLSLLFQNSLPTGWNSKKPRGPKAKRAVQNRSTTHYCYVTAAGQGVQRVERRKRKWGKGRVDKEGGCVCVKWTKTNTRDRQTHSLQHTHTHTQRELSETAGVILQTSSSFFKKKCCRCSSNRPWILAILESNFGHQHPHLPHQECQFCSSHFGETINIGRAGLICQICQKTQKPATTVIQNSFFLSECATHVGLFGVARMVRNVVVPWGDGLPKLVVWFSWRDHIP